MNAISTIVVGVDFSPGSAAALKEAARIARWNRARVRAVHVIDPTVAEELAAALPGTRQQVDARLIADAQRAWDALARDAMPDLIGAIDVRFDHRARGIVAAARDAAADLLVLGARGTGPPGVGMGTVATTCVRRAHTKVLLVRDTQAGPFRTVVACVDFSTTSLRALEQAARVATHDGAALHVLHVYDPPWHHLHFHAPTPEAKPEFQQQYRDALTRRLSAFAGELGREIDYLKPTLTLFDYQGHRSGVVEYAAQVGADLMVLGTRGRTTLRDLLLGSTAERVLAESACSVLAVPPTVERASESGVA